MAGEAAEAGAVDHRLRVFYAHADRERLGVHVHAGFHQGGEQVARGVAGCEDDVAGPQGFAAGQSEGFDAAEAACRPAGDQAGDPRVEAVFAAQRLDLGAQVLHHGDQAEGADVRLAGDQYLLRRAGAHEGLQHLAAQGGGVAHAGPELAVGEGAGAALAELHVGFRGEHGAAPEGEGVRGARAHRAAAFEDDGTKAHPGECEGGKQAAGAGADDHGAVSQGGGGAGGMVEGGVRGAGDLRVIGVAGQDCGFVGDLHVERVDEVDGAAFAGVGGAAKDVGCCGGAAEPGLGGLGQGFRRVVQGELYFGEAEHGCLGSWLRRPRWGGAVYGRSGAVRRAGVPRKGVAFHPVAAMLRQAGVGVALAGRLDGAQLLLVRAVSFPLAACSIAALRFAAARPGIVTDAIAVVLLALASVVITALLGRTILGLAKGELRTLSSQCWPAGRAPTDSSPVLQEGSKTFPAPYVQRLVLSG